MLDINYMGKKSGGESRGGEEDAGYPHHRGVEWLWLGISRSLFLAQGFGPLFGHPERGLFLSLRMGQSFRFRWYVFVGSGLGGGHRVYYGLALVLAQSIFFCRFDHWRLY